MMDSDQEKVGGLLDLSSMAWTVFSITEVMKNTIERRREREGRAIMAGL